MRKLLLLALSAALLVGCGSNKPTGETQVTESKTEVVETKKEPNQEYLDLIKPFGYDDIEYTYPGIETGMFGHMVDEISLEILAFGYKNDVISTMSNVLYYNISEFDDETITELEKYLEEVVAPFKELDFCEVNYGKEDDMIYKLSLEYLDLDNNDHIKKVVDAGGLQLTQESAENIAYLSFEDTASALVEGGWIQR